MIDHKLPLPFLALLKIIKMKILIAILLICLVSVTPSMSSSVADKFKEFEIIPDILNVAPPKLLEVGVECFSLFLNLLCNIQQYGVVEC